MSLLDDIFRCSSNYFKHLQIFCIVYLSYLISVFFEIFKLFIYLFNFAHVGLDVNLDYDSINTILLLWKKLANALFGQKKQYYAPFPKLIKEISLF